MDDAKILKINQDDEKTQLVVVTKENSEQARVSGYLCWLLVLLGVTEWSVPQPKDEKREQEVSLIGQSKLKRKLLFCMSFSIQLFMTVSAIFSSIFYLYCYFGRMNHFLRFVALLCYWPSLVSAQLICIAAILKRRFEKPKMEDEITWAAVFSEASCAGKFPFLKTSRWCRLPKIGVFICVFLPFPAFIVAARIAMFLNLNEDCRNWLQYIWTAFECLYVFFFASFCYFLYLKRVVLEESCARTADYVKTHAGEFDACLVRVRRLFKDYAQLRKLLLPWLTFVLFNATFGITVVVTWNYHLIFPAGNETTTLHAHQLSGPVMLELSETDDTEPTLCPYSCDKISFLQEKQYVYLIYNMLVVCRHLMTAVLSYFVVRGMDLKYIWDRFRMKLYFMFAADDFSFWKNLKLVVDSLHPHTTVENFLSFLIPMIGFATALLSKNQDDF